MDSSNTGNKRMVSSQVTVRYLKEKKRVVTIAYQVTDHNQVRFGAAIFTYSDKMPSFNRSLRRGHRDTAMRHFTYYPLTMDLPACLVDVSNRIQAFINADNLSREQQASFQELGKQFHDCLTMELRRALRTMGTKKVTPERRLIRKLDSRRRKQAQDTAVAAKTARRAPTAAVKAAPQDKCSAGQGAPVSAARVGVCA